MRVFPFFNFCRKNIGLIFYYFSMLESRSTYVHTHLFTYPCNFLRLLFSGFYESSIIMTMLTFDGKFAGDVRRRQPQVVIILQNCAY